MDGNRTHLHWALVVVLLCVLGAMVALAGCGGSGSPGIEAGSDKPADMAQIKLGGFTFDFGSMVILHPYMEISPGSPSWKLKGYGKALGKSMQVDFLDGGVVAEVEALKQRTTRPGHTSNRQDDVWLAQDTAGNVHILQRQIVDDGYGNSYPAMLVGVAAGDPATFYLPKASRLTVGRTWYEYLVGVKVVQNRITALGVSWHGMTSLNRIRVIQDVNHDLVFNPAFAGPDNRNDTFWASMDGLQGVLTAVAPNAAGYVRTNG